MDGNASMVALNSACKGSGMLMEDVIDFLYIFFLIILDDVAGLNASSDPQPTAGAL